MVGRVFLGRYETIRLLGEGGMGRVYLARQTDLGRQVVVKVMHDHIAAEPKFRERFQRETLLMARFQHPYVVTLYDASLNDPEGPCIVMEYVKGVTLEELLQRNGRLTPQRLSRLFGQLCEALHAAHSEGIVHRDLKPANLMIVDADSPFEKIKVMDFGLAKVRMRQPPGLRPQSDTGNEFAVGTPGYISPEQVCGEKADHRADLYSVGVILYELLTGRLPFTGSDTMDVLLAHAHDAPPPFADLGMHELIPPAIERVVMASLSKKPADRPQSARELAEMYESALKSPRGTASRSTTPTLHNDDAVRQMHGDACERGDNAATEEATARPPAEFDTSTLVHRLKAWMPEEIAARKLLGFVDEVGGDVIESEPGRIHVRLGGKGSFHGAANGPLSWLGVGFSSRASAVDLELFLEKNHPQRESLLTITVVMKPVKSRSALSPAWRSRCNEIFCDLRGYLMGTDLEISRN